MSRDKEEGRIRERYSEINLHIVVDGIEYTGAACEKAKTRIFLEKSYEYFGFISMLSNTKQE